MSTEELVLLLLAMYLFTRQPAAPSGDVSIGDAAIGQSEIQDRAANGWQYK